MKIKEKGLTKEDLKYIGIGACGKVMEQEYEEGKICYTALTPQGHNYNGFLRNTMRAYICANGGIECLFSNLKTHRAEQAIKAWNNGDVQNGRIPAWVWNNYITNGYNTRRGLYADYSAKEARIKEIARSHADYMGAETGDSSADHAARVAMRNHFC